MGQGLRKERETGGRERADRLGDFSQHPAKLAVQDKKPLFRSPFPESRHFFRLSSLLRGLCSLFRPTPTGTGLAYNDRPMMPDRRFSRSLRAGVLILLTLGGAGMFAWLPWEASAEQGVIIDNRKGPRQIRSRLHKEMRLLSVRDLSRSLELRQRESGAQVRLEGPRGSLTLSDGRSIVSSQGPDILLSAPVWKRRKGDWFVPEDFLVRALPQILDATLRRSSPGHYRLERLRENRVVVRLNNYPPDRVRIVFQPQHDAPIRISELPSAILVEFDEYRVVPQSPERLPDPRIVASLDFNSHHVFGAFQVLKGQRFDRFEQFQLQTPFRQVIDVYGAEPAVSEDLAKLPAIVSIPVTPAPSESAPIEAVPDPANSKATFDDPRPRRPVIALDPGHGGLDGGQPLPSGSQGDLLEKAFALQIANRIRSRLKSTSFEAVLTRTRDVDLNLQQRSAIANYYRPRAFVSLHLGRSIAGNVSGPVVFIHARRPQQDTRQPSSGSSQGLQLLPWDEGQQPQLSKSRRLANVLQRRLNALFGSRNRVVEAPMTVLAPVAAPAVLVELGFVSNPSDAEQLRSPAFQEKMAAAVVAALEEFLS